MSRTHLRRHWQTYVEIACDATLVMMGIAVIVFMLAGCASTTPTERSAQVQQAQRESVVGRGTADVVSAAKVNPPNVIIEQTAKDGTRLVVTQPAQIESTTTARTEGVESSDSSAKAEANLSETIPLYWKLIMLAVAVIMLLVAVMLVWRVVRNTIVGKFVQAASNAAWVEGGDMVAAKIHNLRNRASTSTDPNVILALKTEEAELQRLRAEMLED